MMAQWWVLLRSSRQTLDESVRARDEAAADK